MPCFSDYSVIYTNMVASRLVALIFNSEIGNRLSRPN